MLTKHSPLVQCLSVALTVWDRSPLIAIFLAVITVVVIGCVIIGARCSSVVRAFAHGAMGRPNDPSWWTH